MKLIHSASQDRHPGAADGDGSTAGAG